MTLIVAVVPWPRQPRSGVRQPEPSTSQALSEAAAMTGRPTGMPVALEASGPMTPMGDPGCTRSERTEGSMGTAFHFQSQEAAHFRRL